MKHIHKNDDKIIQLVQKQLGKDVDAEVIAEVSLHMKDCPDCHIYLDSFKQTINLIKNIDVNTNLPIEVEKRLYKTLKLEIYN
ncbi:MAG: hypothetical protein QF453_03115 [Candidatus Marinimicrobia bacterium]|nr:hypothetical protein [Candidatus Neomarinimicrobiota bacterium]